MRRRIAAGTLPAERIGGRWWVWLEPESEPELGGTSPGTQTEPDGTGPEPIEARFRATPAEIEQAIERTGARYVADIRTLFEELDARYEQRYRDQLEAKAHLFAELRRRAETAEAERNRFAQERAALATRLEAVTKPAEATATSMGAVRLVTLQALALAVGTAVVSVVTLLMTASPAYLGLAITLGERLRRQQTATLASAVAGLLGVVTGFLVTWRARSTLYRLQLGAKSGHSARMTIKIIQAIDKDASEANLVDRIVALAPSPLSVSFPTIRDTTTGGPREDCRPAP